MTTKLNRFKTLCTLFLGVLLSGCAMQGGSFVSADEFTAEYTVPVKARLLHPGDELEFSVEVNGKVEVPPARVELNLAGMVPAPLIGDVKLDGMTLVEARNALEKGYSRIFVSQPMVAVRMTGELAAEWGYVTVLGRVGNPGRFPIASIAGMNLSDALHAAGGFGDSANMQEVVVTRDLPDGKQVQCLCDVTRIGQAGSGHRDLTLRDGDVVFVPERLF